MADAALPSNERTSSSLSLIHSFPELRRQLTVGRVSIRGDSVKPSLRLGGRCSWRVRERCISDNLDQSDTSSSCMSPSGVSTREITRPSASGGPGPSAIEFPRRSPSGRLRTGSREIVVDASSARRAVKNLCKPISKNDSQAHFSHAPSHHFVEAYFSVARNSLQLACDPLSDQGLGPLNRERGVTRARSDGFPQRPVTPYTVQWVKR